MAYRDPEKKRTYANKWAKTEKAKAYRSAYRKTAKYKAWKKKYLSSPEQKAKTKIRLKRQRSDPKRLEKSRAYGRERMKKLRERLKKDKEETAAKEKAKKPISHITDADIDRYIDDICRPKQTRKDDPT